MLGCLASFQCQMRTPKACFFLQPSCQQLNRDHKAAHQDPCGVTLAAPGHLKEGRGGWNESFPVTLELAFRTLLKR